MFLFELVSQIIDDPLVEVVAAEQVISAGGFYFKYAVAYVKY